MSSVTLPEQRQDAIRTISRREFLRLTGVSSTGLVMGICLPNIAAAATNTPVFSPNLFIHIPEQGPIGIVCHRSEMGQGIRTGILQLIADELEASIDDVEVIQATGDKKYGNQNTDGSKSIRLNWIRLREMAAYTRERLRHAAAQELGVDVGELRCETGYVKNAAGDVALSYQSLAQRANDYTGEVTATLKDPSQFRYIGKGISGVDVPDFVSGRAEFGMDVKVDDMVHVALVRAPIPGGTIKNYSADKALAVAGVSQVITLDAIPAMANTSNSIGVVASNTWAAFKGCEQLEIDWDLAGLSRMSDSELKQALSDKLSQDSADKVFRQQGERDDDAISSTRSMEFYTPFLVHAPMEPLVATAYVDDNGCEVWAPTQHPQLARSTIANYLGIAEEQVTVNVTFLGGGFGRKSQPDFILEAVAAAKQLGVPVKVVWSREDEVRHGFYHPAALQRIDVGMNADGKVLSWDHRSVFSSMQSVFAPNPTEPGDWEMFLGATTLPYDFDYINIEGSHVETPVRRGWLRSVHNIFHSFAVNTAVDELAREADRDPIEFSLDLIGPGRQVDYEDKSVLQQAYALMKSLMGQGKPFDGQDTSRLRHVIEQVKILSRWEQKQREGRRLGFAHHYSFGSYLAFVVELEEGAAANGQWPAVKEVYGVMDCGHYVNENIVKAQLEGSVAFSLSVVYYGEILLDQGQVVQSNFHDYRIVRAGEMPPVTLTLIDNHQPPQGVGEPGVPAFLPALTNALARASGKTIRELPIKI